MILVRGVFVVVALTCAAFTRHDRRWIIPAVAAGVVAALLADSAFGTVGTVVALALALVFARVGRQGRS